MNWLPLMDYSMKTGVSLSTLRRHIKANKIEYRIEGGRYLVAYNPEAAPADMSRGAGATAAGVARPVVTGAAIAAIAGAASAISSHSGDLARIRKLEADLRRAQEEIAELKMLVALYEEQITPGKLGT